MGTHIWQMWPEESTLIPFRTHLYFFNIRGPCYRHPLTHPTPPVERAGSLLRADGQRQRRLEGRGVSRLSSRKGPKGTSVAISWREFLAYQVMYWLLRCRLFCFALPYLPLFIFSFCPPSLSFRLLVCHPSIDVGNVGRFLISWLDSWRWFVVHRCPVYFSVQAWRRRWRWR